MNNHKLTCGLVISCLAAIMLAGCIPDDSLQWSDDGSVGLLRVGEALYLVDGETGELTPIARKNVSMLPDISSDGKLIVYCQRVDCNSLSEGLKLLPPGQVRMIEHYAERMKAEYLDTQAANRDKGPFPVPDQVTLPSDCRGWAVRYLCENADGEFRQVLGKEALEKGKQEAISYFQIVVVPRENLTEKRIVAVSALEVTATQLSPDARFVAYLMRQQEEKPNSSAEQYDLYIASMDGDIKAMLVDSYVAFGYDWRQDSRAIAYLSADAKGWSGEDEESSFGSLDERMVADAKGNLLAGHIEIPEGGSARTHTCGGKTASLAGIVYYPWLKATYGSGGRIFFSGIDLPLPASKRDDPQWSLFCYDSVTGTVAHVLPTSVLNYTSQATSSSQFALSPDGKKVLLPIRNHRFVGYELGTDSMAVVPEEEDEGFADGEDELKMVPSWKGNDEITFLVSEKSHYLPKAEEGKSARRQIVLLGISDGGSRILSENWPDEAVP